MLPATVSPQSSHSDSACQPPSHLLQLMSPSAVATVRQACCACTGHFYGAYLISPSMYWGRLLTAAGHQATWPEAGLYIPGNQIAFAFCFSARTKLLSGKETQSHLLLQIGRIKMSFGTDKHKTSSINYIKSSYEAGQIAGFVPQWSGDGQISLMSSTEATSTQKLSLFRKQGRPVSPTILE